MANTRPDLGFGNELEDFDPAKWSTSAKPSPRPQKVETRQLAEAVGFKSREASSAGAEPKKTDRRRRTGRNAQFNLKARPETIEAFCRIADSQGWGLGETLEQAVALLERELSKSSPKS